ncbi:MAG: MbtH family protein [Moraxellaceae bacterium]|nr:MAG: MbtH family protein [Moraxellaceae bacterium]
MSQSFDHYVNPFDDEQQTFLVLKNSHLQYSLWPNLAQKPQGWDVVFGPAARIACIDYIESHWHSINPFQPAIGS